MQTLSLIPLAAATLIAAVYAHLRLAGLCRTAGSLLLGRGLLLGTGIGFGLAMVGAARVLAGETGWIDDVLVFLSGFGVVHVPAALIMAIKLTRRREGAGPQEPDEWP